MSTLPSRVRLVNPSPLVAPDSPSTSAPTPNGRNTPYRAFDLFDASGARPISRKQEIAYLVAPTSIHHLPRYKAAQQYVIALHPRAELVIDGQAAWSSVTWRDHYRQVLGLVSHAYVMPDGNGMISANMIAELHWLCREDTSLIRLWALRPRLRVQERNPMITEGTFEPLALPEWSWLTAGRLNGPCKPNNAYSFCVRQPRKVMPPIPGSDEVFDFATSYRLMRPSEVDRLNSRTKSRAVAVADAVAVAVADADAITRPKRKPRPKRAPKLLKPEGKRRAKSQVFKLPPEAKSVKEKLRPASPSQSAQ